MSAIRGHRRRDRARLFFRAVFSAVDDVELCRGVCLDFAQWPASGHPASRPTAAVRDEGNLSWVCIAFTESPIKGRFWLRRRNDQSGAIEGAGAVMRVGLLIGFLLSVVTLNGGTALAQTVNLLCSGTFTSPEFYVSAMPTTETLAVDFGSRTVSGPTGTYPFTSSNETRIEFYSAYFTKGDIPMVASGKIDRVSGETTIIVRRQNQPQGISVFYALSCHPARPAF